MKASLATKIEAANEVLIEKGQLNAIGEFFSPEYTIHFHHKDTATGHKIIHDALGLMKKAFPKVTLEMTVLVESENRIAWMRTLSGKQEGAYKGFPASHRTITWREMVTSEFRDGLIAQEWFITDLAEQLLRSRKS